jgi:hypothetical protein
MTSAGPDSPKGPRTQEITAVKIEEIPRRRAIHRSGGLPPVDGSVELPKSRAFASVLIQERRGEREPRGINV